MHPTIKTVPATRFLVSNHPGITVPQVPEIAAREIDALARAAGQAGFELAGDSTFFYVDCDGSPDKPFHFAIGLPVSGDAGAPAPYELREAPAFRCMAVDYIGGMPNIKESWHAVYDAIGAQQLTPSGEAREVYKKWVDFDSPENVTEIQAGVA